MDSENSLNGYRKIDTIFGRLDLRPDGKLVFIPREQLVPHHFTFHPGTRSGFVDIHKKSEDQPTPVYETLYRGSHKDLTRDLEDFGRKFIPSFVALIKPVTIGWLHHRGYGICAGYYPSANQLRQAGAGTGKRLKIDATVMKKLLHSPDYLEDIFALNDRAFPLFKRKPGKPWRQVGILFKGPDRPEDLPRLYWIKLRDLSRVMEEQAAEMEHMAQRYWVHSPDQDTSASPPQVQRKSI